MTPAQLFAAATLACAALAVTLTLALAFWHTAQALDSLIASGGW